MRLPSSEEEAEKIVDTALRTLQKGSGAAIYLLGEGTFWVKGAMPRRFLKEAIDRGAQVRAGERDLLARGIAGDAVEAGVGVVADIEGDLVEDVMHSADRVVSW